LKQFIAVVESLVTIVLVLAGVIGISYRSFRDGGWFMQGFGKVVDAYVSYPLAALAATVALYFVYRAGRLNFTQGRGGKRFDLVVYGLMAAGIYFIAHYVINGSF
jgi:hypothetical protein